jgi:hypothetical protein
LNAAFGTSESMLITSAEAMNLLSTVGDLIGRYRFGAARSPS